MAEYLPSSSSSSSAAEKIAASSDLLTEILIRLPTRSLSKFKCVSKYWLSIITSHFFALLRNPDSTIVSGLFLQHYSINPFPEINFIPLINTIETPNPLPQLTDSALFLGPSNTVEIINSCHGLLLCSFSHIRNIGFNLEPNYFIINPTTKIFKILPKCYLADLTCLTLAFDPSKSPQYKVFGLRYTTSDSNGRGIMMYSSETGSWKDSGVPFTAKYKTQNDAGVYWNGAVNWFYSSRIPHSVYYNVDDERLGIVPLPPILEGGDWFNREYFRHYGESRGHLHLIELYDRMRRVHVYEMERDYHGWFLKFSVDLDTVGIPRNTQFRPYCILCVVQMERDEESFLVLHVPGKVVRYIFGDGTLEKICDVVIPPRFYNGPRRESRLTYSWLRAFEYIESLFGV